MIRNPLTHLVLATALLLVMLSAYGLWYAGVGEASKRSAALDAAITAKAEESERVVAAKTALLALASEEASIEQYFVPQAEVVPFLGTLQKTGSALGADVEVLSVAAEEGGEHPHLTLSLSISGSFESVMRTLGAIEYGPYDSRLSSLTLDTPLTEQAGRNSGVWSASAVFTIGSRAAPTLASTTTTSL